MSNTSLRLGLLWESDVVEHAGDRYLVRVAQKGARLKTPGPWVLFLGAAAAESGLVAMVVLLPIRVLSLLVFGQRYKVGVIRLDDIDDEDIVHRERIKGEPAARARGREVLRDLGHLLGTAA